MIISEMFLGRLVQFSLKFQPHLSVNDSMQIAVRLREVRNSTKSLYYGHSREEVARKGLPVSAAHTGELRINDN